MSIRHSFFKFVGKQMFQNKIQVFHKNILTKKKSKTWTNKKKPLTIIPKLGLISYKVVDDQKNTTK